MSKDDPMLVADLYRTIARLARCIEFERARNRALPENWTQERLGPEFEAVLFDNLWELYARPHDQRCSTCGGGPDGEWHAPGCPLAF
jgi:hypothetical protein